MANSNRGRRGVYEPSKHFALLEGYINNDDYDKAKYSVYAHVAKLPSPDMCQLKGFPKTDIQPIISSSHYKQAEAEYRKVDYRCPKCKQMTPKKDVVTHTRFDQELKAFEEFHYILGESPEPRSLRTMWTCPNPDCGKTMDITHEEHWHSVTVKQEVNDYHNHCYMPKPPDLESGPNVDYVKSRALMIEWIGIAVEKLARGAMMLAMSYGGGGYDDGYEVDVDGDDDGNDGDAGAGGDD